jgi:hypothetical protein
LGLFRRKEFWKIEGLLDKKFWGRLKGVVGIC